MAIVDSLLSNLLMLDLLLSPVVNVLDLAIDQVQNLRVGDLHDFVPQEFKLILPVLVLSLNYVIITLKVFRHLLRFFASELGRQEVRIHTKVLWIDPLLV